MTREIIGGVFVKSDMDSYVLDKMSARSCSKHLIVCRNGKPEEIAAFYWGYPSERSNTLYIQLELRLPSGSRVTCWHKQTGYGYDKASSGARVCMSDFFSLASSGCASPERYLRDVAEWRGFKNYLIVG